MKTEYKKDLRHNYMIVAEYEGEHPDSYSMKMLEYQKIGGILPVEQRRLDEKILYYYDISSKQSLAAICDRTPLTKDKISRLCTGINHVLESACEYLLTENDFILMPEYIFIEVGSNEPSLCFLPGYAKPVKEQMSSLLEYLMNKVDYNDREAVLLVYRLYAISREEGYTFEHMIEVLQEPAQAGVLLQKMPGRNTSQQEELQMNINLKDAVGIKPEASKIEEGNGLKRGIQKNLPEYGPEESKIKNKIPVMMEKLEKEVEVSGYPLKIYLYTAAVVISGLLILILSFCTKVIYNTFGSQIDYMKLSALLLVVFCVEGYLLKIIWDRKNKITRIVTQNEYVNPDQYINSKATEENGLMKTVSKDKEDIFVGKKPGQQIPGKQALGLHILEKQELRVNTGSNRMQFPLEEQRKEEWEEDNPTCLLNSVGQDRKSPSLTAPAFECILKALDEENDQAIPITNFPFFIGKLKESVDYCLERDVVSRYHAKLFKENNIYYIMDMNSTNGTFVNGEALITYEKREIKQGDEISFADIRYRLEIA
jgi:hypothetical protein